MVVEILIGLSVAAILGTWKIIVSWNISRLKKRSHLRELISLEQGHQISLGGRKMLEINNPFLEFLWIELKKTYYFWPFRSDPNPVTDAEYVPRKTNTAWLNSVKSQWTKYRKVKSYMPL